jgi:hypothetical protein
MFFNLRMPIKDITGRTVIEAGAPVEPNGPPMLTEVMAHMLAINALTKSWQGELITGEEQLRRFSLAQRIFGAPECVELSAEQIVLIKSVIAKAQAPVYLGRISEILETKGFAKSTVDRS